MRYEMSDFPADPPVDFQDARLSPASLRGHLQDLERRLSRARRVTIGLQLVISLLLIALIMAVARRESGLLIEDDAGRPAIRSYTRGGEAVIEFLDEKGNVRASIGQAHGTGRLALSDRALPRRAEPSVELTADVARLTLRRAGAESWFGFLYDGSSVLSMDAPDGERAWLVRADAEVGLYEYRQRPPAPVEP